MHRRLGFLLVCGATFLAAAAVAWAQPPDVFCDGARPIVVIGPKQDSSELVKQLGEGGGMAGLGAKFYGISNTAEAADSLLFLRRYFPAFASDGAAEALTTFARSGFAKAGALSVAVIGGYLVYEGISGDHQSSVTELPHGALYGWKPAGPLVPCGGSLSEWANSLTNAHAPGVETPLPHTWEVPVMEHVAPKVEPSFTGPLGLPLKTVTSPNHEKPHAGGFIDPSLLNAK